MKGDLGALFRSGIPKELAQELVASETVKNRDVYGTGSRAPQGRLSAKEMRRREKVAARRFVKMGLTAGKGDIHPAHKRPKKKKRTR